MQFGLPSASGIRFGRPGSELVLGERARLILDYVKNVLALPLTCSRAATSYAMNAAGLWTSSAEDKLRQTDRGLTDEPASTVETPNYAAAGSVNGSS